MALDSIVILTTIIAVVNTNTINDNVGNNSDISEGVEVDDSADAFKGVYSECFLYLSYSCLQKKTLLYLKALNNLTEVSVIGDYVKFVKINTTEVEQLPSENPDVRSNSEALSLDIDNAVNNFFDSHILRFKALGKDIAMSHSVDEFVGRKKRKGGGGGGGGGGHDDGKKKMMMMAMMCMKMKMMMMIPAMMGMMGMMSFKGMMFSMMTFMMSKIMLLMKILEKKGGGGGSGGGGGGGGGDGWAAGGGGGGAWMPAGGQDYGGGGGGGGYDANGQWQSRSIIENEKQINEPIISYVTPLVRYNNNANGRKPYSTIKNLNDEVIKSNVQSRKRREIIDAFEKQELEINEPKIADGSSKRKTHSSIIREVVKGNLNSRKRKGLDDVLENQENTEHVKVEAHDPAAQKYVNAYKENANVNPNYENSNIYIAKTKKRSDVDEVLQSQSFTENGHHETDYTTMSYIIPLIKYNSNGKPYSIIRNLNNDVINMKTNIKSRQKRGIIDVLQNTYLYWMNQVLGSRYTNKLSYPKYRIVNGVKYVYYPLRYIQKAKKPKALNEVREEMKTVITAEDFNKGEIVEGPVESRMHKKKLVKMKDNVNETVEDNPWE